MMYLLAFVIGALGWTLSEYIIHRGWGHRPSRNPFTVEHLAHHKDMGYFAPAYKKLGAATLMAVTLGPILFWTLEFVGLTGLLGFIVMYGAYEIIHRLLHVSPGWTRYGRWARRHHLHHHYRRPHLNHGVTTPIWDILFRTLDVPDIVRVPRKKSMAWMIGDDGELKPGLETEYVLVGRPPVSAQTPKESPPLGGHEQRQPA